VKNQKCRILESALCTAVALTILSIAAACGGSNIGNLIGGPGSAIIARISNHPSGHNSIQPKSSNGRFLSALFQSSTPTASELPESFEGTCDATAANPAVLASGFAVLNVPNGITCGNGTITVAGAVGAFANNGIPVAFSGTITVLKVSVITQNNQHVRCVVTDHLPTQCVICQYCCALPPAENISRAEPKVRASLCVLYTRTSS
jgi:hypothetical protein